MIEILAFILYFSDAGAAIFADIVGQLDELQHVLLVPVSVVVCFA